MKEGKSKGGPEGMLLPGGRAGLPACLPACRSCMRSPAAHTFDLQVEGAGTCQQQQRHISRRLECLLLQRGRQLAPHLPGERRHEGGEHVHAEGTGATLAAALHACWCSVGGTLPHKRQRHQRPSAGQEGCEEGSDFKHMARPTTSLVCSSLPVPQSILAGSSSRRIAATTHRSNGAQRARSAVRDPHLQRLKQCCHVSGALGC